MAVLDPDHGGAGYGGRMDLGGAWRVAAATERRRRTFHEFDYDDSGWVAMRVPSHWAQAGPGSGDAGADLAGEESVLYRHRFEGPREAVGTSGTVEGSDRRWWLRIEGLAQQGDIWLDGSYLGHTDGYFVPHELEVTEQLATRSEHLLAVDATCRRFTDPDNRTLLTGALQDPELCGVEGLIVGGVWRPVRLRSTGLVAIRHARAVCAEVSGSRGTDVRRGDGRAWARLELRAVLDVPGGGAVYLRTRVAGTEHVHSHHAADGDNRVEWSVDVADPPLWWPHALGDQPLCELTMEAVSGGEVHDRRRFRIGFRSVEMRRWVLHVNGERLFIKGANLLPIQRLPGTASPSEVAGEVRSARKAGLDMVRPLARIARPELYETADELGVLIWQDLPIRGVMGRSVVAEARRQARESVDLLGHHPSVVVWCAHDEPFPRIRRPSATPPAVSRLGPSWNRDVLDRRLARVLSRCDGSRPVVAHTGVPPHFPSLEGTTSQLWFGLHGGRAADLAPTLARVPAMGQFVSAFGTPVSADQPEVVKTTIEILRRLKYRPTGGFLLHALADAGAGRGSGGPVEPGGGFGLLDGLRRPKPGWQALVDACRPLIVVTDPLPASVRGGDRLDLAVHVVNDTRADMDGMQVQARVLGPDGAVIGEHRWEGAAGADDCVMVGRIDAVVPAGTPPGWLTVELTLTAGNEPNDGKPAVAASNRYSTMVV